MSKNIKLIITAGFLLVLILLVFILRGGSKYGDVQLSPGNIEVPTARTLQWKTQSVFADSICNQWAGRSISDKSLDGKGNAPRILLAKLFMKKDIPEANKTILKLTAWGVSGTSWVLNKKGDYDFSITIYTTILYLFGDQPELLYPETKKYILNVLLTEEGNKFRTKAPRTLGLVGETENHVLMTEGSKYLKNQWLRNHGNQDPRYDNVQNGMENHLLDFLAGMKTNGLYEFNSLPYIGYTITALLNLEAFASDKLKKEARNVLDYMNWTYALGSYQLKHYPPMRRRYEKAGITDITTDYQSVFMKSWLSFSPVAEFDKNIGGGEVHALMGAIMPYRPADKVVEMIFDKGNGYFVKLGHGPQSCPEIFTAGNRFLLSAGGVNRGKFSIIVARPVTLFLDDHAQDLSETIHLAGPGSDFMKWNNTGVYKNLACAAGPVVIPRTFHPAAKNDLWSVYTSGDSLLIAVHSTADFGVISVFRQSDAARLLTELTKANSDPDKLKTSFQFPEGPKITYDVLAPEDKWVMVSADGQMLDREFDKWPLINRVLKN